MTLRAYILGIACVLIAAPFGNDRLAAAAEPSAQPESRWIEIGSEKAVIARDSKSADRKSVV